MKAVAIFLFLGIKSTFITVPCNENVPRLLLQQLRCYLSQVDMIYMDMSKAFDKVNHGYLLQKFHEFGFGGSFLQWFNSYLMGRFQRVAVLGETSDTLPVSSGIRQGSILGPMLFLIYVNYLPDSVLTSHVVMFSDDTKIYK